MFKFILARIDHDRSKRQKYFPELFRHVRLVFASRDIQEPKTFLSGAACNERFFITGKVELGMNETSQCEVYSETTNERQFIANFSIRPLIKTKWLPVSNKVTLKLVKLLFGPLVIQLLWYIG